MFSTCRFWAICILAAAPLLLTPNSSFANVCRAEARLAARLGFKLPKCESKQTKISNKANDPKKRESAEAAHQRKIERVNNKLQRNQERLNDIGGCNQNTPEGQVKCRQRERIQFRINELNEKLASLGAVWDRKENNINNYYDRLIDRAALLASKCESIEASLVAAELALQDCQNR